jgi:hypothetical protein
MFFVIFDIHLVIFDFFIILNLILYHAHFNLIGIGIFTTYHSNLIKICRRT